MSKINDWWDATYPDNHARTVAAPQHTHVIDLYLSWENYYQEPPYSERWIDANQFAKCLVKARITDVGGWWARLPNWEPKEYEIRRAKVY